MATARPRKNCEYVRSHQLQSCGDAHDGGSIAPELRMSIEVHAGHIFLHLQRMWPNVAAQKQIKTNQYPPSKIHVHPSSDPQLASM